ncbi:MAG: DNA-binding protein [Phycisphaerales bacterium]|nr:MAG: DNA-binding protein [Phycisphaerales bacterium]
MTTKKNTPPRLSERGVVSVEQSHRSISYNGPQLLNVEAVARTLSIGERQVWRLMATGELPTVSIGRRRLVTATDVQAFIEARREGGAR